MNRWKFLQVRFEVHKDCVPLPESVLKKAIIESYNDRTRRFKNELTIDQVRFLSIVYLFKLYFSVCNRKMQQLNYLKNWKSNKGGMRLEKTVIARGGNFDPFTY